MDDCIWDAQHWHLLVEELFMLPADDAERFQLFIPEGGIYKRHKKLGDHITTGAEVMKEDMLRGGRSKNPHFVRDHWWDSTAMMLIAQSVESLFREHLKPVTRRRTAQYYNSPSTNTEDIGAR